MSFRRRLLMSAQPPFDWVDIEEDPFLIRPTAAGAPILNSKSSIHMIKGQSAVSRNLWDEEWEVGSLDASGNNYASTTRIRGKNYIPCSSGDNYYILSSEICDIHFYTKDKVHIDGYRQIKNTVFTTPSDAAYIRFCESIAYGTTYKNDICINKSARFFDGQYEPYWKGIKSFPGVTMEYSRNLWDEQWESGSLNLNDGTNVTSSSYIRSVNYIPVRPNTEYYFRKNTGQSQRMVYYDVNKNFVASVDAFDTAGAGGVFTTTDNVYYIRFYVNATYGAHDICINKSDPSFNGQYEPYWEGIRYAGASVVEWNQLAEVSDQTVTKNGITIVVANNVATMTGTATADITRTSTLTGNDIKMKTGHKYLNLMPRGIFIQDSVVSTLYQGFMAHAIVEYSKAEMTSGKVTLIATSGETVSASFPIGLCDLTQMFGAGNEPTTYEEFDFYRPYVENEGTYNAGRRVSIRPRIKSIGRNQWDEQWEVGAYNNNTGVKETRADRIRSKNLIPVIPSTTYCAVGGVNILGFGRDGAFLRFLNYYASGATFTTPSDVYYIAIYAAGTTYNNDICINISDASFNGRYQPYKESTLVLPEPPEGGLRSAGSAYDALTPTKNITRIGVVDLGSLTWYQNGANPQYYSTGISTLIAKPASTSVVANVLCSQYITLSRDAVDHANGVGVSTAGNITIRDDRYPTLAEFQAAISGVMLFYELATPTEVSVPTRNLSYKVWNGGSESIVDDRISMGLSADILYKVPKI